MKEAPVFLELFSGSSRLVRAIAAMGWTVILWDILLGPQYDLRSRRNRSTVVQWVRGSWVRAWHAGFPCNSFSRARDRPGGPPRLRSDAEPRGLKNLRACDQAAVELGNLLLSFTVNLNMVSILFRIPFTLENPALSRAWICPPMPTLLRRRCISQHVVEYCRFGMPWRKSTRFVAYLVCLDALDKRRCAGRVCVRTDLPHLQLCGTNELGVFRTKVAELHPHNLCRLIARAFCDEAAQARAKQFGIMTM